MNRRSSEPSSEWLACEELAERMRVRPATIREWARRGFIPAAKLGHTWRFHWQTINTALLELMDAQNSNESPGGTDGDGGDGLGEPAK